MFDSTVKPIAHGFCESKIHHAGNFHFSFNASFYSSLCYDFIAFGIICTVFWNRKPMAKNMNYYVSSRRCGTAINSISMNHPMKLALGIKNRKLLGSSLRF